MDVRVDGTPFTAKVHNGCFIFYRGASPSGKAFGFGPNIRRFESFRPSIESRGFCTRGFSSVGRARAFQARCHGFDPRKPLWTGWTPSKGSFEGPSKHKFACVTLFGERRGLNPRMMESQSIALTTWLRPPSKGFL